MGNNVVKEFNKVPLGKGHAPNLGNGQEMIAPGSVVLRKPMTVLVKHDDHRETTIFFDLKTMLPLYVSKTKTRRGTETTITKDAAGKTLFLTICQASKNKRLIYRAPDDIKNKSTEEAPASSSGKSNDLDSSVHSASSSSSSYARFDTDVPCTAQIDIDRSSAAVSAFLSIYVWKESEPELLTVYKAVKIPRVKYGALVTCLDGGEVVGKSFLDEQRMQPKIQVAAGADLPSVVALASAVLGEF